MLKAIYKEINSEEGGFLHNLKSYIFTSICLIKYLKHYKFMIIFAALTFFDLALCLDFSEKNGVHPLKILEPSL